MAAGHPASNPTLSATERKQPQSQVEPDVAVYFLHS